MNKNHKDVPASFATIRSQLNSVSPSPQSMCVPLSLIATICIVAVEVIVLSDKSVMLYLTLRTVSVDPRVLVLRNVKVKPLIFQFSIPDVVVQVKTNVCPGVGGRLFEGVVCSKVT